MTELKSNSKRKPFVVIADGDKGGTGKSFEARALSHALVASGANLIGIDGDARNGHLNRHYSDTFKVERIYLRDTKGWSTLIDVIAAVDEHTDIVLDLPGNIGEIVAREMPRFALACERLDRLIYRMWVINAEFDSVNQLMNTKDLVSLERTIVVKNGLFGEPEAFSIWERSKIRGESRDAGSTEIYAPEMPRSVVLQTNAAQCSFADAGALPLTFSERLDWEIWLASTEQAFEPFVKRLRGA